MVDYQKIGNALVEEHLACGFSGAAREALKANMKAAWGFLRDQGFIHRDEITDPHAVETIIAQELMENERRYFARKADLHSQLAESQKQRTQENGRSA